MCGSDLLCTSREANAMFKITRISSMALLQKKKSLFQVLRVDFLTLVFPYCSSALIVCTP